MTQTIRPITPSDLLPRRAKSQIDQTPIHIGDTVVLRPANGPDIRATVIYNAPINGTVTYTTDVVRCGRPDQPGMRIRFRHEHVHRIESVRQAAA
ncbi:MULTISPECIES: hypothetical protein [unclassified Bordetella]|uniref:hypothetical protein n=1 Tax=unclassified Bordetella TaxID=2630031 RepID=UPI0013287757|nr:MULTISPECIES: hypothetical protein [unclassified Bordetella]MVW71062.1 hypothetical protein [Bordetella sp. 15P40C-2]MVW80631.1 hypothetical protein [Bordetella sp. 02P26C-1]